MHNVLSPSIVSFNPGISKPIGMKNQRSTHAIEMHVEMSDVAGWKHQNITRVELYDQSQFIKTNLSTFPLSKRDDDADLLVKLVPMSVCGDTEVDNHPSKWMDRGIGVEWKTISICCK
jgi:hypothetical protein